VNTLYIIALLWMAEVFSPSYGNQSSPFGLGIAHPVRRRRFHEIDAQGESLNTYLSFITWEMKFKGGCKSFFPSIRLTISTAEEMSFDTY